MIQDAASLQNLHDIVEPVPVPWWPLAPGWWAVIVMVAVALLVMGVRAWKKWKRNAYRRAALTELQTATTASAIDQLLKRTALCAFPRSEVASLSGEAWCEWLGQSASLDVPPSVSSTLTTVFTKSPGDITGLSGFAAEWIRNHSIQTEGREEREGKSG